MTVAVETEVTRCKLSRQIDLEAPVLTLFSYVLSLQLQSSVTEFEFSQEEYRQLQVEFWSKFYACCLQYQEALSMPLGLTVSQHTGMVCLLKKVKFPLQLHAALMQKPLRGS